MAVTEKQRSIPLFNQNPTEPRFGLAQPQLVSRFVQDKIHCNGDMLIGIVFSEVLI